MKYGANTIVHIQLGIKCDDLDLINSVLVREIICWGIDFISNCNWMVYKIIFSEFLLVQIFQYCLSIHSGLVHYIWSKEIYACVWNESDHFLSRWYNYTTTLKTLSEITSTKHKYKKYMYGCDTDMFYFCQRKSFWSRLLQTQMQITHIYSSQMQTMVLPLSS